MFFRSRVRAARLQSREAVQDARFCGDDKDRWRLASRGEKESGECFQALRNATPGRVEKNPDDFFI